MTVNHGMNMNQVVLHLKFDLFLAVKNEYLLTYRYRKLVDPFFAEGNSVYWVPEGLNLIQSAANCEIRA